MKEKIQEKTFAIGDKVYHFSVNDLLWYWFVNIERIGVGLCWKLLDFFQDLLPIWEADRNQLKDLLMPAQLQSFEKSRETFYPDPSIRLLLESDIRFIHWDMEEYPDKLRHIFQPPLGLYVKGRLPDPHTPSLAMVGSRRATNYGKSFAREIACQLAGAGVQIISGLASGIDAESHRGALLGGGYTLGVLGGGIDTIYPKGNFNLYYEMYACGGVLSEYNTGIPNRSGLFPMRNRIISGLSDGVLVVEAGKRSGSLITADHGLEQGKEIFALPGRVTDTMSGGCNDLIAQGAVPVTCPEVLLDYFLVKKEEMKKEAVKKEEITGDRIKRADRKKEGSYNKEIKETGKKEEELKNDTVKKEETKKADIKKERIKRDSIRKDGINSEGIRKDSIRKDSVRKDSINSESIKKEAIKKEEAKKKEKRQEENLDDETRKVLDIVDVIQGKSFDQLCSECGIGKTRMNFILYDLECKGLIFQPVQGLFQRRPIIN